MELSGDVYLLSTHLVPEKIIDKRLSVSLDVYSDYRDRISQAFLVISIEAPITMDYRYCRWRVSLNKFNVSRLLRPFKEVVYGSRKYSLLLYDLTPIKHLLEEINEVVIEYKGDFVINLDLVGLLTTYNIVSRDSREAKIYLLAEPMIIESKGRSVLEIPRPSMHSQGFDMHIILKPLAPATDVNINGEIKTLQTLEEHLIHLSGESSRVSIEVSRGGLYVPLVIFRDRVFREPSYDIKNIEITGLSGNKYLIKAFIENSGDVDVKELLAVALYKGRSLVSKKINGGLREFELELDEKMIDPGDPRLTLRIIWNWLGNRYFKSRDLVLRT